MPASCLENEGTQNKEPWTSKTPKIHPKHLKSQAIARRQTNEGMQSQWQEPLGNQACREMSKEVHRRTVGATALMARSLSLVIRNAIASVYRSSSVLEAMTGQEKFPAMPAAERISWSQKVRTEQVNGWPDWRRNRGPGELPQQPKCSIIDWTVHKGGDPWHDTLHKMGWFLKPLSRHACHVGKVALSTSMPLTFKFQDEQKLANEGTMNLAEYGKRQKVRVQAAHNLQ